MKKTLLSAFLLLGLSSAMFGQFSIQKVVFEEFTGAWCQYCADGAYRAEQMDANFPDALMIALHVGDAMQMSICDTMEAYYGPAYPQALFNRSGALVSRGSWSSTMSSSLQGSASVTVSFDSVSYDPQTRVVNATVRALFTGPETGDMRINMALVEKTVTGTGSGYNQSNADNSTPGHPYQGAGNPIVGFVHRHVARDYAGGPWGVAGVIPSTVNFGAAFTQNFTYTLPQSWNAQKMELVAFVTKIEGNGVNDRPIINGEEFDMGGFFVGMPDVTANSGLLEVLGNPLTERSKVVFTTEEAGNFKVEVLNMLGQQVAVLGEGFSDKGIHTLYWDGNDQAQQPVKNGMYLIRLSTEGGQSTAKRVLVAH